MSHAGEVKVLCNQSTPRPNLVPIICMFIQQAAAFHLEISDNAKRNHQSIIQS